MNIFVGMNQSAKSPEGHMAGMVVSTSNVVLSNTSSNTWLIDTGATDHMCCNYEILSDLTTLLVPIHIALPNGTSILVTHIGSVHFNDKIHISNVLLVLSFNYNLFLCQNGHWILVAQSFSILLILFFRPKNCRLP